MTGKPEGPFKRSDLSLDDVDLEKSTKFISTSVVAVIITDSKTAAPQNDESVYRASRNARTTNIRCSPTNAPYEVYIAYGEEPPRAYSFFRWPI